MSNNFEIKLEENKVKTKTEILRNFFWRIKNQRVKLAKWLFEKLLGSFLISTLISYGSFAGVRLQVFSFQSVYIVVTFLSVFSYVLSVFLIPSSKETRDIEEKRDISKLS
jgi:hypothetical protein